MEAVHININRILILSVLWTAILISLTAPASAQYSLYQFREFTVTLEKYPPDRNPYTSVEITLDGKGVYQRITRGQLFELETRKDFKLSVKQLEYLYYNIMRQNFFEIYSVYGNPNMRDGTVVKVTVKIDHQTHSVTMYDERYLAVDMVVNTVLKVVPEKYARTFRDDYDGKEDIIKIKLE